MAADGLNDAVRDKENREEGYSAKSKAHCGNCAAANFSGGCHFCTAVSFLLSRRKRSLRADGV